MPSIYSNISPRSHSRHSSSSASNSSTVPASSRPVRPPPPSPMSSLSGSSAPASASRRSLRSNASYVPEGGLPAGLALEGTARTSSVPMDVSNASAPAQAPDSSSAQPMIRGTSNTRRAAAAAGGRPGGGRFFIPDSTGSSPCVAASETHTQPSTYPTRGTTSQSGHDPVDASGSGIRQSHTRRDSEDYHQYNPAPPVWRNIDSDFELDLGDYGTGEYASASSATTSAMHSRSASDASSEGSYGVGDETVPNPPTRRALFPTAGRSAAAAFRPRGCDTGPGDVPLQGSSLGSDWSQSRRHGRPADITIQALQPAFDPDNPFLALASHHPGESGDAFARAASPHTPVRYSLPSRSQTRPYGIYEPDTDTDGPPPSSSSSPLSPFTIAHASRIKRSSGHDILQQLQTRDQDMPNLGMPGLPPHMYEILLDIHQTLYLGRTYAQCGRHSGESGMGVVKRKRRTSAHGSWRRRVKEIKRVVEKSLEGDCVYDHPLVRLTNRDALLSHFILLHLAASAYLPSISPSALIHHTRNCLSLSYHLACGLLFGRSPFAVTEHDSHFPPASLEKGKGPAVPSPLSGMTEKRSRLFGETDVRGQPGVLQAVSEWYDLPTSATYDDCRDGGQLTRGIKGWWQLWEVNADCKEIGGMECYDGIHLAMIEQVITFTLLPALLVPTPPILSEPCSVQSLDIDTIRNDIRAPMTPMARRASGTSGSDDLSLPLPMGTHGIGSSSGFVGKLVGAIAREFEYLLKWELPINTMVEFNEVGKATRIRDMVDIQDLVETFVPFAKRFSWLTRSLNGLVTSAVGNVLLGATAAEAVTVKGKKGVLVPITTGSQYEKQELTEKALRPFNSPATSPCTPNRRFQRLYEQSKIEKNEEGTSLTSLSTPQWLGGQQRGLNGHKDGGDGTTKVHYGRGRERAQSQPHLPAREARSPAPDAHSAGDKGDGVSVPPRWYEGVQAGDVNTTSNVLGLKGVSARASGPSM